MDRAADSGIKFEAEVANLYRMLGYEVTPNIDFDGFQVDIIARRRVPGADDTKLMIECKFKSSGLVSNEELSKLSNTFTEAGRAKGFHIVTNTGFSQKARAFASDKGHIVLKTVKDLEEATLDLFSGYGRYKREYVQNAIFTLYIPLRGRGYLPGAVTTDVLFDDIAQSLITWIDSDEVGFLNIMGDFGAGKTTLLERIKFHYSDLYESGKTDRKPILFRAKDLHKFSTISEFLESTVVTEFRTAIDVKHVWRFIQEGRFIVLIDGFDEVAQQVDSRQRRYYFIMLSALFNNPCKSS